MKTGDLLKIKSHIPVWVREDQDPVKGGVVGKYPCGTILLLLSEDDPELYHHKVLTPDGRTGWIFKDDLKMLDIFSYA